MEGGRWKKNGLESDYTWINGGITAPKGFQAAGIACGIKKRKKDLALIYSEVPATAAGVFTQNHLQAAPLIVTRKHIKTKFARAIIANSGNANCATGQRGIKDAYQMVSHTASFLGLKSEEVLVASTGVIGRFLPMEAIQQGIERITSQLSPKGSRWAAEAILTTDHSVKEVAVQMTLFGKKVTIGAIAKGAGMIAPQMATMLCFITTDAKIAPFFLQKGISELGEITFNAITIDGEMSTNDMVLILANGQAANPTLRAASQEYQTFLEALRMVMEKLAQKVVQDGEGATKFVEINVTGARKKEQAKKVAQRIANSLLVKTMLHGGDPNWGRIAACVGSSGIPVRMNRVGVTIGPTPVFLKGEPLEHSRDQLKQVLRDHDIQIGVDLGEGKAHFRVWTTDLSAEYVKINAGYTS